MYDDDHNPIISPNAHFDYTRWYYDYARLNDRITSFEYYLAADVHDYKRYSTNHMFMDMLGYFKDKFGLLPIVNSLNDWFLVDEPESEKVCPFNVNIDSTYHDEIDFSQLDWYRLDEQTPLNIMYNAAEHKTTFIAEIYDHENQWTYFESLFVCYYADLQYCADPDTVNGRIDQDSANYFLSSLNDFMTFFSWMVTRPQNPFDFNSIGIEDEFPIRGGHPYKQTFLTVSQYLYLMLSQYRYIDCRDMTINSESVDFWLNYFPLHVWLESFGSCIFPALQLDQIRPLMQEIESTHITVEPDTRYVSDLDHLEVRAQIQNPGDNIAVHLYYRNYQVENYSTPSLVDDIYHEIPVPGYFYITCPAGRTITAIMQYIDNPQPGDYISRDSLRTTGVPEYCLDNGSQHIPLQADPITGRLIVKDTISEMTAPHELLDINEDGHKDIFGICDGQVVILLNDGTGEFYNIGEYIGDGVTQLDVGDLNHDGILDIAIANPTYIASFNGDGFLNFEFDEVIFSFSQNNDAKIADLDGDGWNDLIIGTDSAETNLIYYNDGFGNLLQDTESLGDEKMEKVHCTDVDNNGSNDLVMSKDGKLVIEK